MAGRERKASIKNLGVKKEADIYKQPTSQSEANINVSSSPKKEQQKCASSARKLGLRKKATGGANTSKAPNKAESKTKGTNATGKKLGSSDTQPKNPKSAKLIQDQKPNNAAAEPPTNQQNIKRAKLNKTVKTETPTTKAPESTESNASSILKKPQVPKVYKLNRLNKLGTTATGARIGTRNRNAPYVTRSDSPARVLRNGKRRKLKDPSLLEGLDVRCPKRRRLLSSTKDVSASDVVIKSEVLDDQASVAGSDISYNDSHVENGKANWDLVHDVKPSVEGSTILDNKKLKHEDPEQVTDNCLGKAISNKIAELISRNKFLETLGKDLAPKTEETIFKPLPIKTEDISTHDSFVKKDENVPDKSADASEKELPSIEKGGSISEQHHTRSSLSQNNAEKRISEIAQNFPSLVTVKKEPSDHLELQLKNGQNRSYRLSSRSLSEKAKKIRDFKLGRSKTTKMYQSCPSSSGMFYVVEDPADIAARQVVSSSSGECSSSNSFGTQQEVNNSNRCNIKDETEMSHQGKATIGMQPSTSFSPLQKGAAESREIAGKVRNKTEEESATTADGPDSTISDMNIKSILTCEKDINNCDPRSSESAVVSPVKIEIISNSSEESCTTKMDILENSQEVKESLHVPCSSVESSVPACETRCVEEIKVKTEKLEERTENTHLRDLERLEDKLSELVQAATSQESVEMDVPVLEEPSKVNDTDENKCLKTINDCSKSVNLTLQLVPKEEIKILVEDSNMSPKSEIVTTQDAKPAGNENTTLELAEVNSTIEETPKSICVTLQETNLDSCVEEPVKNSTSDMASKLVSEKIDTATDKKGLEASLNIAATEVNSFATENEKNVISAENDQEMIQEEIQNCDDMQVETTKPEMNRSDTLKSEVDSCIKNIVESETIDNLVNNIDASTKELPIEIPNPSEDVVEDSSSTVIFETSKQLSENSLESSPESQTLTEEETKLLEVVKSLEHCSEESQQNGEQDCKHVSSGSETQSSETDGADCQLQKCDISSPLKEINDKSLEMSLEQESVNSTANVEERKIYVLHNASADACQVTDVKKNDSEEICKDTSEAVSNFVAVANLKDANEGILLSASENLKATADGNEGVEEAGVSEKKEVAEEVSPEELAVKESVLSALGLQPLRSLQTSNAVNNHEKPCDNYTGTLKTVIKLSRSSPEKRHRSSVKFVVKQGKSQNAEETAVSGGKGDVDSDDSDYDGDEKIEYSISHEPGNTEGNSFAAGSKKNGKSSYSYRSYFDISSQPHLLSEKNGTGDTSTEVAIKDEGKTPSVKQSDTLVIPEKSSSFSIHPERLCSDVCSYCFGKFGSLDTPCHIAQLKSAERQQKILEAETHLTADSCLCDACYRHVDRKANCPSYKPNKKRQRHRSNPSQIKSVCCVQGCSQPAHHHVRRKWLVKLKRSIAKKAPIDLDKMPQHLPFPVCSQHYYWIDFFMLCGICKRRLTRNHMYPLGPEVRELNAALIHDGIPVRLSDKLFLCKLCRYFASLRMKYKNPSQLSGNHKMFFQSYRKRILHYHDIEEMDEDEATEDTSSSAKTKRRKTRNPSAMKEDDDDTSGGKSKSSSPSELDDQHSNVPSHDFSPAIDYLGGTVMERPGATTPMIDYSSLGSVDDSGAETMSSKVASQKKLDRMKLPKIKLKLGKRSVEKIGSLSVSNDERERTRSIVIPDRDGLEVTPVFEDLSQTSYSAQEELNLHADFDFQSRKQDHSPSRGREWEKCNATIQFDKETKNVFQELRRPYGNYSSFFRHLVLLEKHWRSGDLVLSSRASSRAVTYLNSVQNRIRAYEGHPTLSPDVKSVQSTSAIPTTPVSSNVPIIDLPLKGNLGGGILTAADASLKPITITSVSISQHSGSSTSVSSQPPTSVFTFPQSSASSPVPRSVSLANRSPGPPNKRIPNILQVTAGGKSFSIMPGFSHMRQFRSLQPRKLQPKPSVLTTNTLVQSTQRTSTNTFEPMICDVRSLATEAGGLWDRGSVEITPHNGASNSQNLLQPHQPSISVSILPNTVTSVQHVPNVVSPKPSTIVTPTGIILSRKPDLSVTTIVETKDSALKPKSAAGRKDEVQMKAVSEKTEAARTTPVLEISDSVLTLTAPEKRNILPKAKC